MRVFWMSDLRQNSAGEKIIHWTIYKQYSGKCVPAHNNRVKYLFKTNKVYMQ
jgi:hypothetical protein